MDKASERTVPQTRVSTSHSRPMTPPPSSAAIHVVSRLRRGRSPVGAGVALGDADRLLHHLLG